MEHLFDKFENRTDSAVEKNSVKYGAIGALIAFFLYILCSFPFLGIPAVLVLYPFTYLGNVFFHDPNLFIYWNNHWMDFAVYVTPLGILMLLTVGFLIGQCIIFLRYPSKKIIRPTILVTLTLFVVMSLLYSAKYSNSYLTCSTLPESYQTQCFWDMADKYLNPSLCEKTGDGKDFCYSGIAQKTSNITLCDKAGDFYFQSFRCYQGILSFGSDPNSCSNVLDTEKQNACQQALAVATKDSSKCNQLNTTERQNTCLYQMACQFKDESICNLINSENGRKQCIFGMENTQYDSSFNSCRNKESQNFYELHIDE